MLSGRVEITGENGKLSKKERKQNVQFWLPRSWRAKLKPGQTPKTGEAMMPMRAATDTSERICDAT